MSFYEQYQANTKKNPAAFHILPLTTLPFITLIDPNYFTIEIFLFEALAATPIF